MGDRFAAFPGVREFPEGVRTAADAARAVGCEVGAICKSLVFVRERDGAPLLVIASGANRVDEAALGVRRADPAFVRDVTGAAIGGVPPFGHPAPVVLDRYRTIGAAIYRTDLDGAVTVETDGRTVKVHTFTHRLLTLRTHQN